MAAASHSSGESVGDRLGDAMVGEARDERAAAPPVHAVASRHAVSFASLPEFTNSTVSSPTPAGMLATSRSASSTGAPVR